MRYFTADPHFGHTNILHYCDRPFTSINKMNKVIIENINEIVKPDDILYVLGDVGKTHDENIEHLASLINRINCRKILILGNHDKLNAFEYVDMGFESVHTYLYIEDMKLHLVHDPAVTNILPKEKWLCGHVHGLFTSVRNTLNVGVDIWNFYPVSEDAVKAWMDGDWVFGNEDKRPDWMDEDV